MRIYSDENNRVGVIDIEEPDAALHVRVRGGAIYITTTDDGAEVMLIPATLGAKPLSVVLQLSEPDPESTE